MSTPMPIPKKKPLRPEKIVMTERYHRTHPVITDAAAIHA
jgi:hypothetical protein